MGLNMTIDMFKRLCHSHCGLYAHPFYVRTYKFIAREGGHDLLAASWLCHLLPNCIDRLIHQSTSWIPNNPTWSCSIPRSMEITCIFWCAWFRKNIKLLDHSSLFDVCLQEQAHICTPHNMVTNASSTVIWLTMHIQND